MRSKDDARLAGGACADAVIASEAKQSRSKRRMVAGLAPGLLRRCAPRNDGTQERVAAYVRERALLRSSMNTACAPNRFHSHHGALTRTGLPYRVSAMPRSMQAPTSSSRLTKSRIVQRWMFGVSYHA